jgi:hypothetical protein
MKKAELLKIKVNELTGTAVNGKRKLEAYGKLLERKEVVCLNVSVSVDDSLRIGGPVVNELFFFFDSKYSPRYAGQKLCFGDDATSFYKHFDVIKQRILNDK